MAVGVRRLHDVDRRGWWLLTPVGCWLLAIPVAMLGAVAGFGLFIYVGAMLMLAGPISVVVPLAFFCVEGTRGANRFGPDPKGPSGVDDLAEVFR